MTQDRNSETPAVGPGARLMQARLDLHLAREDVSAKLHMSSHQIQALEENDYSVLPGATYVRGYLRNYAMLLGLDPAPILAAHAQMSAKPAHAESEHVVPSREITSHHHQIRFTTYLVVFIVIGLAVAWWQGRDVRPPNPLLTSTEQVDGSATPAGDVPAADTAQQQMVPTVPLSPTKLEPATPPSLGVALPAVPAGPHGRLVIYADRESWVDIRDGRQTKLAYETLRAGRVLTLDAATPISVFIGNAAGVRAEYNGKLVDITKYKAGVTARFSLSESMSTVRAVPAQALTSAPPVIPAPARTLTPVPAPVQVLTPEPEPAATPTR